MNNKEPLTQHQLWKLLNNNGSVIGDAVIAVVTLEGEIAR